MTSFRQKIFFVALVLFFFSLKTFSQYISIYGTVKDTSGTASLQHSVAMAVRLGDSSLTRFTRTDDKGYFRMDSVPVDTYQVVVSHPGFGDQTVIVLGSKDNNTFDLQKIVLPPKTITLNEVTIFGYTDAVYYRGDTLVYTADSFKVKQNAVVEDLLKKLPGIKVDSKGKIYSQGKEVDQVLVDGDEFFGSDPTVATKNLAAKSVESVQVYDKKNENATESSDKETLKIMDLKLKEEAKKGYFGKVSGATDFKEFYEGELLANHFKGKQKISVFGLASNTPRTAFNWNDMYQYGMNNEYDSYSEDGYYYSSYDNSKKDGIPKTQKTGFYFTDMISKKTKLGLNYTYNKSSLEQESRTTSQYFLADTTYKTENFEHSDKVNQGHTVNASINYDLDSLTKVILKSKYKKNISDDNSFDNNTYVNALDALTRTSNTGNISENTSDEWNNSIRMERDFKKKDRRLVANYGINVADNNSEGFLKSFNAFFDNPATPNDSTNQRKTSESSKTTHIGSATYTEPLSKKVKLEFSYDFNISTETQNKRTMDFVNGNYSTENPVLTNDFETIRISNRESAKFIYQVKKQTFKIGTKLRQVDVENTNLDSEKKISQSVNNVLPFMSYNYKFGDNTNLYLEYNTSSDQPSIYQLQPVPDNSNPNYLSIGNPDLLPTYRHSFGMHYYSYKPITGRNMWASLGFSSMRNSFSNRTIYDSIGRTITQPVNVQGNYTAHGYLQGDFPFASRMFELTPDLNFNYSRNINYINEETNETRNFRPTAALEVAFKTDSIELSVGGSYSYNSASSSLSTASDQSYFTRGWKAEASVELPWKMKVETDINHYEDQHREEGYNLNYLIWNASLGKRFLKNENLTISIDANDLLDQNISTRRDVVDNVITDVKTNIIGRYIMLKAVFKFNSNKDNDEEEE